MASPHPNIPSWPGPGHTKVGQPPSPGRLVLLPRHHQAMALLRADRVHRAKLMVVSSSSLSDNSSLSDRLVRTTPNLTTNLLPLPNPSAGEKVKVRDVERGSNEGVLPPSESPQLPNRHYKLPDPLPQDLYNVPVGGRLQLFHHNWKSMGATDWIVQILREGYRIQFLTKPTLTSRPLIDSFSKNQIKNKVLLSEIQKMLDKRAIEEVVSPGPGYYSRLFVVPKPNGKWRPIIDLKRLNRMTVIPKFKMETVQSVMSSLTKGNFAFSIDLSDAYFHIPIHPRSRKYLRICFAGRVFQFRALPFGLSSAPWIFTKVMSEIKEMVHIQGIRLYLYLDDWLVEVINFNLGCIQSDYMVELCCRMGLLVNQEKSELVPTQRFDYIGATFDLVLDRVYPLTKNVDKFQNIVLSFLHKPNQTARSWQRLIGTLNSQFRFVPLARLHTRPFQWHLLSHWIQGVQSQETIITVSTELQESLKWWLSPRVPTEGVQLSPLHFSSRIFTDASNIGWGGHLGDQLTQGLWSSQEQKLHINVLEMRAVINTLKEFLPPMGSNILVSTDNTTVVAHINKEGGTHSWALMVETFSLFMLAVLHQWTIKAVHIPGKLNVIADHLSRQGVSLPTEWSLKQEVVDKLFLRWGNPHLDLFATRHNTKCEQFVSPVPDNNALAVDALSLNFDGMEAYAYPPTQIISKVLQKFQQAKSCKLILIASMWPKQPWFPLLCQLVVEEPVPLPPLKDLLRQPLTGIFHADPEMLQLHAWRLAKPI